ncbi:MAG: hypothetical protein H8E14_02400 [Candidatus Marinimicrobia bacterium]|nr:hypothetical protein [Candidatus Neomarinimicrobiota bacterium]
MPTKEAGRASRNLIRTTPGIYLPFIDTILQISLYCPFIPYICFPTYAKAYLPKHNLCDGMGFGWQAVCHFPSPVCRILSLSSVEGLFSTFRIDNACIRITHTSTAP